MRKQETPNDPNKSMLAALRWVDYRLETPERRSVYPQCPEFKRAMFNHGEDSKFALSDNLRTDVGMARFFAGKALIDENKKFREESLEKLRNGGFTINSIVCVGDAVASWVIVGKHFFLEIKS